MATEITLLESSPEAYGGNDRRVLYWYTISPRITDATAQSVAPQNRSHLPDDAVRYLSEADKVLIDNGDAGFEVLRRHQCAGETNVAFRARMLADHDARQTWWVQHHRTKYGLSGTGATG